MPMEFFRQMTEYPMLIGGLVGLTIVALLLTVIAAPWFVARLPVDYLTAQPQPANRPSQRPVHWILVIVRSTIGVLFFILGVIMLITPGPGLVMIVAGISLTDFPGKHRLVVWLASRDSVLRTLNWIRRRHNKPPLQSPVSP